MRKITFLLSLFLLCIGSVSAQMFEASPAPTNGEFAADTKWYFIQFANSDTYHSAGYLATEGENHINSDGVLLLNGTTKPMSYAGIWCMVGNENDGYTFYNKGAGATHVLGIQNGLAKMYATDNVNGVSTTFDYTQSTSSLAGGPYATFKVHGSDNQYWNNSDAAPKCHITIWNDPDALGDNGSAIKITEVTAEDLQMIEAGIDPLSLVIKPTTIVNGEFAADTQWYRLTIRSTKKTATALWAENNSNNTSNNNSSYNGLFAFTGSLENGYQIYNYYVGAGKGLYGVGNNNEILAWSATPSTFELKQNTATGYQFKLTGDGTKYINDVESQLGLWTAGASATDGGSTFIIEPVTDMDAVAAAWPGIVTTALQSDELTNVTTGGGSKIGEYPAEYVNNLKSKIEALSASTSPSVAAVREIASLYQEREEHVNMPEAGKLYRIISAMPAFETNQGVRKALQNNGQNMGWATASEDNTDIRQIWTLTPVDGGYTLQSQRDEDYPGIQTTQSATYSKSTTATVATLTPLGERQFNIKTNGSNHAFHTGGHSSGAGVSGDIVAWNAGINTGSAWYIEEITMDDLTLSQMKLRAFHDDNVASFPTVGEDMTQVIWPGEYNFSSVSDKADLFTHAAEVCAGTEQAPITASLNDIREYRTLSRRYGFPASVVLEMKAQYSTIMLPGNIAVPQGVTAYNCSSTDNGVLNLERLATGFKANTPYIVEGPVGEKYQLIGYNSQNANASTVTTGLLTGVYEATPAPVGSYVLQIQNGKLGFYLVGDTQPTVGANRCYLTLPAEAAGVRALFFGDGNVTGIETAIGEDTDNDAPVYDLSGRRVAQPRQGLYIVGGKKVFVK